MDEEHILSAFASGRWVLTRRGQGVPSEHDFEWQDMPPSEPADGQVLVQHEAWSVDSYMRSRMRPDPGYAPPQAIGEPMLGATVGRVTASRHPAWSVGQQVLSFGGWQTHQCLGADALASLWPIPEDVPASLCFGALGMPGITAWHALENVLGLRAGDRLWVDAAAGGVGLVACQWARARGAEVLPVVGDDMKAEVLRRLGFEPLVLPRQGVRAQEVAERVLQRWPSGITAMVEHVGGAWWEGALQASAPHARCALVGLAAGYDDTPLPLLDTNVFISKRLSVQAFIISEHRDVWPQARAALLSAWREGALMAQEDVMVGVERLPEALARVVRGENVGKQVVRARR